MVIQPDGRHVTLPSAKKIVLQDAARAGARPAGGDGLQVTASIMPTIVGRRDVRRVVLSPDGRWLLVAHGWGPAKLCRIHPRGEVINLIDKVKGDSLVAFSADSRRIVTIGAFHAVARLWQVNIGRLVAGFQVFGADAIVFTPDGDFVESGTVGNVRLSVEPGDLDFPTNAARSILLNPARVVEALMEDSK